jgi:catechol 2,3-dioxygenase-like lactoylglutathione lyase family enzyme
LRRLSGPVKLRRMTEPSMGVEGVDFISVASQDLTVAERFYADTLGLPRSSVYQRGETPPVGMEFETGNLTLSVIHSAALGMEFQPNNHPIALRVADVAEARAALEAKGVVFAAETLDTSVCHMAFFRDPDGNALMLHRRYAPK